MCPLSRAGLPNAFAFWQPLGLTVRRMKMNQIIIFSIAIIVLLNLYVSIRIWRKEEFSHFQKVSQSIIVWLIPLVGALLIMAFIKDDETPKGPYNTNDGQGVDGMPGGVQ